MCVSLVTTTAFADCVLSAEVPLRVALVDDRGSSALAPVALIEIATISRNHKPAMAQQPMAGDAFDEVINDGR
jgi:hypothetical protein